MNSRYGGENMLDKSVINKIKDKYFELRPSEAKVAEYILKNSKEVAKMSIGTLASETEVSQPTIVRFVKAIGYSSYREFKDDIISNISRNLEEYCTNSLYGFNLKKEDRIKEVPKKAINTNINILKETLNSINIDSFEEAIKMIIGSKKIAIFGVENSVTVVNDLANKLMYLGLDVRCNNDVYMQNLCAASLTKDDLAIGISYSGTSKDTVDAMKKAKENGAKTLIITNFEKSIISKYADKIIHTSSSNSNIYGSAIFSRTNQIVIVDMLYMGIILSDYERFSKELDKNGQIAIQKSYQNFTK